MNLKRLSFASLLAATLLASTSAPSTCFAQEATDKGFADELPRIPPTEPADALKEMAVKPGYKLELAAEEPLVRDPVAMAFDEKGRMFVVEMVDYSEQDKDFLGTIKLLEDKDGDGHYETSTIYAEKLSWPTGVICYDGGVFVAAAPDVWYFKDEDGDGKAEIQKKVFTGFGRTNVQGLMNSFLWGLDNRIYCQISSSGANISRPDLPDVEPVKASGRDFSFDPKTLEFRLESGGGQHGMTFDDWGRRYTCSNSDHLQLFLYADRYARAENPFPLPPSRRSVAEDGPQANVYRISPVEPWRIVRTRLRVTNVTPGAIEGGGRASGYFTSATGITIYRGNSYPKDMAGVAIMGDVGSNIVHRKKMEENGISMIGRRVDVESEFVASKDIWFRPVQFANSPDGNLYIADLYREVIEHPLSLPPQIKQHLDLTSGRDRGRIYRIVPEGYQRQALPNLSKLSLDALLKTLESTNGWHRDTASRLLFEKLTSNASDSEKSTILAGLTKIATSASLPQGRLHALGLLQHFSKDAAPLITALRDAHPRVREWAIRWLEDRFGSNPEIASALEGLASDADTRVRFQLALSLTVSDLAADKKSQLAYKVLKQSGNDPYITAACFNAIGPQAVEILEQQLASLKSEGEIAHLLPLAQVAGRLSSPEQLSELDGKLTSNTPLSNQRIALVVDLVEALQNRFTKGADLSALLQKMPNVAATRETLLKAARDHAGNEDLSVEERLSAIKHLMWNVADADIPLLVSLFQQQDSQELQNAAGVALRKLTSPEVPKQLLAQWARITPKLRGTVIDIVFSRPQWIDVLLENAEQGNFNLVDLDVVRLNSLRNGARTKARAEKLVANADLGSRAEVFEKYRPALTMQGDRTRGKEVFAKSCAACHKVEGVGYEIGPNLPAFQFRGAEAILSNIIEPNREVNPQYVSYTIMTKDERILTGMITNESAASVTLTRGDNQSDTIERSEIAEMKSSRLSLMPEGLEQQIDLQSMADLLSYLTTIQQ